MCIRDSRRTGPDRASGERNGEATEDDRKDNWRSDPRAEARPLSRTREASPLAVGGSIQPSYAIPPRLIRAKKVHNPRVCARIGRRLKPARAK
eukprot:12576372-Alexandrium_andersonii.AAC.1